MKSKVIYFLILFVVVLLIRNSSPEEGAYGVISYCIFLITSIFVVLFNHALLITNNMKLAEFFFKKTYSKKIRQYYEKMFMKNIEEAVVILSPYKKIIGYRNTYKLTEITMLLDKGDIERAKKEIDSIKSAKFKNHIICYFTMETADEHMFQICSNKIKDKGIRLVIEADWLYFNGEREKAKVKAQEALKNVRGFQKYILIQTLKYERPEGYKWFF